jgi:hypothetical protein
VVSDNNSRVVRQVLRNEGVNGRINSFTGPLSLQDVVQMRLVYPEVGRELLCGHLRKGQCGGESCLAVDLSSAHN